MERNQLLAMCETQIFSFEEFKNFDKHLDSSQVRHEAMDKVVAYGQFKLFLELKTKIESTESIDRKLVIDWLTNRTTSQYKGFDFAYNHTSAVKVKNKELDVKLAYADWDASQTFLAIIEANPTFCTTISHSFP